jgi:hypothetical protein
VYFFFFFLAGVKPRQLVPTGAQQLARGNTPFYEWLFDEGL